MNILLAGDLHFSKPQFRWLAEQKEIYDCLCLTGDFLDHHSGGFEQQIAWISCWMKDLDKQIFICSGNHDLNELAECDWLTNIKSSKICSDNQTKIFQGIKFGCIPYLGGNLSDFCDCDILLSHVPPFKTATSHSVVARMRKDWGDEELYNALKERVLNPRYVLCGHVENPVAKRDCLFGVEIINPGAQHNSSIPSYEMIAM